jgi:hypothetical protein
MSLFLYDMTIKRQFMRRADLFGLTNGPVSVPIDILINLFLGKDGDTSNPSAIINAQANGLLRRLERAGVANAMFFSLLKLPNCGLIIFYIFMP